MSTENKPVLVTGAGGFIGSHVVEVLLHHGYRVRALVHYNSRGSWGHLQELGSQDQLEVRLGDVTDAYLVRDLVDGCGVVLHLAALIGIPYSYHAPASYIATNVGGTLNLLEACRHAGVGRVVVTSTSEVYGTARYAPIDEAHPLQAQSPYAASKIAADKLAESYFCSYDLPVVVLRPFNTYGPRQSARAVIPTVLVQAMAGSAEIRLGNLAPQRDLTFVQDTARAFLLASQAPGIEGQVIHFGQGNAISIADLAQRCLDTVGSQARIVTTAERQRPDKSEVELLLCNAAKAQRLLGWTPEVSLEEGLRRTADYVRAHLAHYRAGDYAI
jgi:NAD dependent epimerase/dehydratase